MADRERLIATLPTSSKINDPGEVRVVLRITRKAHHPNAHAAALSDGPRRDEVHGMVDHLPEGLLGQLIEALELARGAVASP